MGCSDDLVQVENQKGVSGDTGFWHSYPISLILVEKKSVAKRLIEKSRKGGSGGAVVFIFDVQTSGQIAMAYSVVTLSYIW